MKRYVVFQFSEIVRWEIQGKSVGDFGTLPEVQECIKEAGESSYIWGVLDLKDGRWLKRDEWMELEPGGKNGGLWSRIGSAIWPEIFT